MIEHRDGVGIVDFPLLQTVPELFDTFAETLQHPARQLRVFVQSVGSLEYHCRSAHLIPLPDRLVNVDSFFEPLLDQVGTPILPSGAVVTLNIPQPMPHLDKLRSDFCDPFLDPLQQFEFPQTFQTLS